MARKSLACLLLCATLVCGPRAVADRTATSTAQVQTPAQAGIHKAGPRVKADTSLARALEEYRSRVDKGAGATFKPGNRFLQVQDGRILVDIRAQSNAAALLSELTALGLVNAARYGDIVSGQIPFSAVDAALQLADLRSISASPRPVTHAGSITSQGDVALRADIARSAFAVDGSGVTVGVVSDSFDTLGGAASDIASGDLPAAGVPVLNGESTLCGVLVFCIDEGRAMLQIVHDMAPGADLLFQSGIDGLASYANAIANLAATGADIIVDDLLLVNEPMFQDGIVAQAIDAAVAGGVAYFTAAGNSGRLSYESAFNDSGEIFCIEFFEPYDDCDPMFERVGSMHDFDPGPGVDNYLNITVPVNGVMTVAMQWDQPYGGSGPRTDHDIVLLDGSGETYITIGANDNIAMGEGWEVLQLDNNEVLDYGTEFTIMLTYDDVDSIDPPATLVKLVIFGDGITINEFATSSGTLFGHANAAGATAVGAAFFMDTPMHGVSPPLLQPYSSAGGTPILFDSNGVRHATPVIRQHPDIVAVDGVNTTFFFDDSYGNDGIDDFFGTSAAAPHAAGVAALVLAAKPSALPGQVNRVLRNTAIDMDAAGVDFNSGYGLVQADAAIAAALTSYPRDMNGNGQADILWRNTVTGQNRVYLMNGASIAADVDINSVASPDWQVVGNGDYNGDTNADILWRHVATGAIWVYLMNGNAILSSQFVATISDPNWTVAGSGDYNGDGLSDILWHHAVSGTVWLYEMNGNVVTTSTGVGVVPNLDWTVVGNGDYNGDGRADVLWRNVTSGTNWMYLMDGASITTSIGISVAPDQGWKIVGNGDYNGDGKSDILWRHAVGGANWVYLMNGTSIATSASISVLPDPNWKIVGDGDYNGDGKSDVLWRNTSTGSNRMYLMDGLAIASNSGVNTVADQNWLIINSR